MASVGPQLPPHLAKRKRTPDDDGGHDSPSAKKTIANDEELDLAEDDDSDSDDGYGPAVPRSSAAAPAPAKASVGPTRPHVQSTDEIPLDDEDAYGESSNTGSVQPPRIGPAAPAPPPKRVHGPSMPPADLSQRPPKDPDEDSDDEDDDDYGPALPTSAAHQSRQSAAEKASALAAQAGPAAPTRDDWMLAPPSAGDSHRAADPTKIRARKFNSGPRAGASSNGGNGGEISSIWTETPEQKRKRLEDAVLGRDGTDKTSSSAQGPHATRPSRKEEERAAQTRANIEAARGPSLYEEHQRREGGQGGRIEQEEDDPSKRAFDREKDMKLGGRIGTAQRRELLTKAADFGGRFSKGKYL